MLIQDPNKADGKEKLLRYKGFQKKKKKADGS